LREELPAISNRHFKEAVDKVMMGEKLDRKPNPDELYRIAVHESGHALISELLRPGSVSHLTVTNRGRALGYMRQIPEDDLYLYTKEYLVKQIQVYLAGAVSESIILGARSTGASSDFNQAVQVARQIIAAGLSPLGIVCEEILSKDTLHQAIQEIIQQQEQEVASMLDGHLDTLKEIASLLVEQEYISGSTLQEHIGQAKLEISA
jgi:vesicle-fusing ATPase